jgi:hypothetical protein
MGTSNTSTNNNFTNLNNTYLNSSNNLINSNNKVPNSGGMGFGMGTGIGTGTGMGTGIGIGNSSFNPFSKPEIINTGQSNINTNNFNLNDPKISNSLNSYNLNTNSTFNAGNNFIKPTNNFTFNTNSISSGVGFGSNNTPQLGNSSATFANNNFNHLNSSISNPANNNFLKFNNNTSNTNQFNRTYNNINTLPGFNTGNFTFNNLQNNSSSMMINNNFNQHRNLMGVNNLLSNNSNVNVNKLSFNPYDDYLGVKSICKEVNENLYPQKFSKREMEDIMDFSLTELTNGEENLKFFKSRNNENSQIKNWNTFNYDNTTVESKNFIFNKNVNNFSTKSSHLNINRNFSPDRQSNNLIFGTGLKNNGNTFGLNPEYISNVNQLNSSSYMTDSFIAGGKNSSAVGDNINNISNLNNLNKNIKFKPMTIQEIIPLGANKNVCAAHADAENKIKDEGDENNMTEQLFSSINKENVNKLKIINKSTTNRNSYYDSPEYFREILKLSELAHSNSVGPYVEGIKHGPDNEFLMNPNPFNTVTSSKNKLNTITNQKHFKGRNKPLMKTILEANEDRENVSLGLSLGPGPGHGSIHGPSHSPIHGKVYDTTNGHMQGPKSDKNFENINSISPQFDTGILNLHLKMITPVIKEFNIKINKKNKAFDLKLAIEEILKENFSNELPSINYQYISVFSKRGFLKDTDVIEDNEFLNEKETLYVLLEEENSEIKSALMEQSEIIDKNEDSFLNETCKYVLDIPSQITIKSDICPITKKYKTEPSIEQLNKMKKEELERVYNFNIYNEHGKISFKGYSDLTYLNLDEIVDISPLVVNVYSQVVPPEIGQKLNKEARVHVYNMDYDGSSDQEYADFVANIKKSFEGRCASYVDFNPLNLELIFDVICFNRSS